MPAVTACLVSISFATPSLCSCYSYWYAQRPLLPLPPRLPQDRGGASYRVGVIPPKSNGRGLFTQHTTANHDMSRHTSNGSATSRHATGDSAAPDGVTLSLLATLAQAHATIKPAVIIVEPIARSDEEQEAATAVMAVHDDADGLASIPVLEVQLWAADQLSAVVEVDRRLVISRADAAAGLLFGLGAKALLRKRFTRWAAQLGGESN